MSEAKELIMTVSPNSPESRWVALGDNDAIISEGRTPNEVMERAKRLSNNFILMFVPIEGASYIF